MRTALGNAPGPNHEAHHIVPDNVVRNSPLHKYAIEQGWYDVDRVSNGKYLAKSDADKVVGKSDILPTHSGSHRNYDEAIKNKIDQILQLNLIDPSTINSLNQTQTIGLINKIESEAQTILLGWAGKLN